MNRIYERLLLYPTSLNIFPAHILSMKELSEERHSRSKMGLATTTTATNIPSSIERAGALNAFAPAVSSANSTNRSSQQSSGIGEALRAAAADDGASSSTNMEHQRYNRTNKIPKIGYLDHGSHCTSESTADATSRSSQQAGISSNQTHPLYELSRKQRSSSSCSSNSNSAGEYDHGSTSSAQPCHNLLQGGMKSVSVDGADMIGSQDASIQGTTSIIAASITTQDIQSSPHSLAPISEEKKHPSSSLKAVHDSASTAASLRDDCTTATTATTATTTNTNKQSEPLGLLHAALQGSDPHHQQVQAQAPSQQPVRPRSGECLTNPSKPDSNHGLDNEEGNLIVYKNDIFSVPIHDIRYLPTNKTSSVAVSSSSSSTSTTPPPSVASNGNSSSSPHQFVPRSGISSTEKVLRGKQNANDGNHEHYQVLGILGQGTFAQVFKCRNTTTGQLVAVKIVKNKPAYTRQSETEIEVFEELALNKAIEDDSLDMPHSDNGGSNSSDAASPSADGNLANRSDQFESTTGESSTNKEASEEADANSSDCFVKLLCHFTYKSHLCLVFELLGLNLYELLKRRQFRGLPIRDVRVMIKQALRGLKSLSQRKKKIVHCDLKPENILVVNDSDAKRVIHAGEHEAEKGQDGKSADISAIDRPRKDQSTKGAKEIKIIDFGSACLEGNACHTYIQSRFYRSPEVLIGLEYDSAIDTWSLGCVAAELFFGLPILPGTHEHDQIGRICEMIGPIPDWMLEQGQKTKKYFKREQGSQLNQGHLHTPNASQNGTNSSSAWRLKSREEFIESLSSREQESLGGLAKLEQQPTNKYFKKKLLEDNIMSHGNFSNSSEKEELGLFIHFLKGLLNPNPIERWTAGQAWGHPFITGKSAYRRRNGNLDALHNDISWTPDWDPTKCKRILAYKEGRRRSSFPRQSSFPDVQQSQEGMLHYMVSPNTRRVTDLAGAMSISHQTPHENEHSPSHVPNMAYSVDGLQFSHHHQNQQVLAGSLGANVGFHYPQHQHMGGLSYTAGHSTSLSHLHHQVESQYNEYGEYMTQPPANLHDNEHQYHAPPPRHVPMGAQSFSGIYYDRVSHASDLGYALQRPGVVPNGNHQPTSHVNPYHSLHQNTTHPSSMNSQYIASSLDSFSHLPHQQQHLPPPPGRFSGSLPQAMISPDQYQPSANLLSSSYSQPTYEDLDTSDHRLHPAWNGMYRGSSM